MGIKISYGITTCSEIKEIQKLIPFLLKHKRDEDEIVVLYDGKNGREKVWRYLAEIKNIEVFTDSFEGHFAEWKNRLFNLCTGDFIFQIDSDEIPHVELIKMLPNLINMNPSIDVFLVPRINTVKNITEEHIKKWGWFVNEKGWVNFPDFQWRIYKNNKKIKWVNKVHERLEGFKHYAHLSIDEENCLYHHKDIKRQEKQNDLYSSYIYNKNAEKK